MKKFIAALLLTASVSTAFAQNCSEAYEIKGNKREALKMGIVATAGVASFATGTVPLFLIGATAGLGTNALVNKGAIKNQFTMINSALYASHYGLLDDKDFQKVAAKIRNRTEEDFNLVLDDSTISKLISEADRSMNICPLIKVKKNGEEKRGTLSLSGFVDYISNVAGTGKTEIKIINHIQDQE